MVSQSVDPAASRAGRFGETSNDSPANTFERAFRSARLDQETLWRAWGFGLAGCVLPIAFADSSTLPFPSWALWSGALAVMGTFSVFCGVVSHHQLTLLRTPWFHSTHETRHRAQNQLTPLVVLDSFRISRALFFGLATAYGTLAATLVVLTRYPALLSMELALLGGWGAALFAYAARRRAARGMRFLGAALAFALAAAGGYGLSILALPLAGVATLAGTSLGTFLSLLSPPEPLDDLVHGKPSTQETLDDSWEPTTERRTDPGAFVIHSEQLHSEQVHSEPLHSEPPLRAEQRWDEANPAFSSHAHSAPSPARDLPADLSVPPRRTPKPLAPPVRTGVLRKRSTRSADSMSEPAHDLGPSIASTLAATEPKKPSKEPEPDAETEEDERDRITRPDLAPYRDPNSNSDLPTTPSPPLSEEPGPKNHGTGDPYRVNIPRSPRTPTIEQENVARPGDTLPSESSSSHRSHSELRTKAQNIEPESVVASSLEDGLLQVLDRVHRAEQNTTRQDPRRKTAQR